MANNPASGMRGLLIVPLLAAVLAAAPAQMVPARADAAATLKSTEACYDDLASDEDTIGGCSAIIGLRRDALDQLLAVGTLDGSERQVLELILARTVIGSSERQALEQVLARTVIGASEKAALEPLVARIGPASPEGQVLELLLARTVIGAREKEDAEALLAGTPAGSGKRRELEAVLARTVIGKSEREALERVLAGNVIDRGEREALGRVLARTVIGKADKEALGQLWARTVIGQEERLVLERVLARTVIGSGGQDRTYASIPGTSMSGLTSAIAHGLGTALFNRALAEDSQGDYEKAIGDLAEELSLDPGDSAARLELARVVGERSDVLLGAAMAMDPGGDARLAPRTRKRK